MIFAVLPQPTLNIPQVPHIPLKLHHIPFHSHFGDAAIPPDGVHRAFGSSHSETQSQILALLVTLALPFHLHCQTQPTAIWTVEQQVGQAG